MKRSEVINIIQKTFELEGLGISMREKDATAILNALLEAGMSPPNCCISEEQWVTTDEGTYLQGKRWARRWEKE